MKNILFSLICCLNVIFLYGQTGVAAVKWPKVSEQITYLANKYEGFRQLKNEALNQKPVNRKRIAEIDAQLADQMAINEAAVQKIIDERGFPGHRMVGQEVTHQFWQMVIIMDHNPDLQNHVLRLMDRAVADNDAAAPDFARLMDRTLINSGLNQFYGTQVFYNDKIGQYEPHPISQPTNLNQRRALVGLPSLEDYTTQTNQKYERQVAQDQKPTGRVWNLENQ